MVKAYSQKVFNGQRPVFDGRKNMYSRDPLPLGRDKVRVRVRTGMNLSFDSEINLSNIDLIQKYKIMKKIKRGVLVMACPFMLISVGKICL